MGDGDHPVNVARLIEGHDGDRAALISRNRTISYDELNELAARLRGGLAGLGVGDGDRVALICGNGHPFVIGYLAALGLGAVVVPLNPTSPAPELGRELAVVRPMVAILDRSAAGAWQAIDAEALTSVQTVVSVDGDVLDDAVSFEALADRRAVAGRRCRRRTTSPH